MSIENVGKVTSVNYNEYKSQAYSKKQEVNTKTDNVAAVYEKSQDDVKKKAYTVNKMSEEDRAALVKQLKEEQSARQNQLIDIVKQMMTGQAKAYNDANDIWKFLASGEYEVSPEVKAQAEEDISENGYYGVKQTSERLFDFASALAGDDPDKMKEMQDAMMKGFEQATGAWGKELPEICSQTIEEANRLFEEYYRAKEVQA